LNTTLNRFLYIASRGYILDKGKIIAKDSSQKLFESGVLKKVFVGKAV